MKPNKLFKDSSNIIKFESVLLSLSISYFISFWLIYFDNKNATRLGYFVFVIFTLILYTKIKNILEGHKNEEYIINILPFCLLLGAIGLFLVFSSLYYIYSYYNYYLYGSEYTNYNFIGWNKNLFIMRYIVPISIFLSYLSETILLNKFRKLNLLKSFLIAFKDIVNLVVIVLSIITICSVIVFATFIIFNLGKPG